MDGWGRVRPIFCLAPPLAMDVAAAQEGLVSGPVGGPVTSLREAVGDEQEWRSAVLQAVTAGAVDAAAGPDGVRPSHLRQLLVLPGTGLALKAVVARYVDAVAESKAHSVAYGLRMAPVRKDGGGWRPVGVGSVFRRAAAAVAAAALTPELVGELELDGQLGLAEAGPQRFYLRAQRAASEGLVVAKLDVRNAFNELDRRVVLRAAREIAGRTVGVARAAAATFHNLCSDDDQVHLRLSEGARTVRAQRGVVQGCPGGSLLFNVAMRDVLVGLRGSLREEGVDFRPMPSLGGSGTYLAEGVVGYVALHDDVVIAVWGGVGCGGAVAGREVGAGDWGRG